MVKSDKIRLAVSTSGDTTTSMAAALSAFYVRIPVGHVEAGLRTFDKDYPFPEEINRVYVDGVCDYYFAPTDTSVKNLIASGCKKENNSVNEDTIKEVLSELLNLPNEKLFKSIQNYSDQVISGEVNNSKEPEYSSILENMFHSQFTDEGYEKFINGQMSIK